jgi:hypothetical protein
MTNLGLLNFFLGIQVLQMDDGSFISQAKYVLDLLQRLKTKYCKSCSTPYQSGVKLTKECNFQKVDATLYKQLVGSLIYLTRRRPIISFVVSVISERAT